MNNDVELWWCFLCAVGAVNLAAWWLSAAALERRKASLAADVFGARRLQLVLSGVYVAGCAFRSFFPVYDVPRIGLLDSWLSSVLLGRSVATVAELCFVAQWALLLGECARASRSVLAGVVSRALVPLIATAEVCSWYSVLTTSNLGHTAEESLWGLAAALLVVAAAGLWMRAAAGRRRPVLLAACAAGSIYVGYMFLVDVPMYWTRWLADEAAGRHYLGLGQGLVDVAVRRVVSHRWEDWRHEVVWMSLYFSVAVWISLALIHVPAPEWLRARGERDRPAVAPARLGRVGGQQA